MKLGLTLGYSGAQMYLPTDLGLDSVWSAEAWGSDAVSPLAWIGAKTTKIKLGTAIMQMPGRSPANTAMTAMTLDALSGGRMILGLGTSGPQVVEGWHGKPWYKPLTWQREYITIVREILKREKPLEFDGEIYQIPFRGPRSKGLGKPLKSILHGRADIPIYTGSMAPKGQQFAGEMCDGCLLTCMHPEHPEVILENIRIGRERAGKSMDDFDLSPMVAVVMGDDLDQCRMPLKWQLALYIGGMGAKKKNFYKDYISKVGYEEVAEKVQAMYLEGNKTEAAMLIPDDLIDALYLVGPADRIRDHFQTWKDCEGIGTLNLGTLQPEAIRLLAELAFS